MHHRTMQNITRLVLLLTLTAPAVAHDTWLEATPSRPALGEPVAIDVKLGNHGNHHRDFKIAGQVDPRTIQLHLVAPDGSRTDLKPRLRETSTDAGEKFWTLDVQANTAGLYTVACLDDKVVHYAPKRSIKSAKTHFLVGPDDGGPQEGVNQALGHPLELIPLTGPASATTGSPVRVQLRFHGEPLADVRVSFIPHGVTLEGHFDDRYERMTDENGTATFTPDDATLYLIVAHHEDPTAHGEGYESTKYSATLTTHIAR